MLSPLNSAYPQQLDVIVVGAGHAGVEASLAAARMGARVLLITQNLDRIGWMSCNPAIGGLGKGHLVKEVDALGGVMARAIDRAGIQFRRLNTRKGPAVRATRAQADKWAYAQAVRELVEAQPSVALRQASVEALLVDQRPDGPTACGVTTALGERYHGRAVVVSSGTFLRGLCHYGETKVRAGRAGDAAAYGLSDSLAGLGLTMARLKTGTVPRLDGRTIDFRPLEVQPGEATPRPFSMYRSRVALPQVACHITHTNQATHQLIRANLHRSPLYAGEIEGVGPRYCPSIEDKVVRFAHKERHQIFLEPEGLRTHEVYPNGIPTSLPVDVQMALVRTIEGLAEAQITRPGYAVEYDMVDPRQLRHTLETRRVRSLFLAGQINGTSGYEEAAIQGLVAGANAVLRLRGEAPLVIDRSQGYAGVLIDDLVTRGVAEPYRMFTSRAEYRLLLREDNADERLMPLGRQLGLLDDDLWSDFRSRMQRVEATLERLRRTKLTPTAGVADRFAELGTPPPNQPTSLEALLRRPEIGFDELERLGAEWVAELSMPVREKVEVRLKYAGYIERQGRQIERFRKLESLALPADLDFQEIPGLRPELRERLEAQRPDNIGQASRLQGMTPGAVSALLIHLKKLGIG